MRLFQSWWAVSHSGQKRFWGEMWCRTVELHRTKECLAEMVSEAELLSVNDSWRNLFLLIGSGEMPGYTVIRSWQGRSHVQILSVHLKLQRKSPPTCKSLGPFQSCLFILTVFQLPWTFWPSSASSFVFCSPKDSSVLFSAHSTSTRKFLVKKPQVEQSVLGQAAISFPCPHSGPSGSFQNKV